MSIRWARSTALPTAPRRPRSCRISGASSGAPKHPPVQNGNAFKTCLLFDCRTPCRPLGFARHERSPRRLFDGSRRHDRCALLRGAPGGVAYGLDDNGGGHCHCRHDRHWRLHQPRLPGPEHSLGLLRAHAVGRRAASRRCAGRSPMPSSPPRCRARVASTISFRGSTGRRSASSPAGYRRPSASPPPSRWRRWRSASTSPASCRARRC